jgi:hypothetical protein
VAIASETVVYDVYDAKVSLMTADTVGSAPTYGSAVDVPGISEVSLDPNIVSAELKGDSRVIARKSRVDRFNASVKYSKLSLDVLAVILGNFTVTAAGSGSTETQTGRIHAPASSPYFKLAFQIRDVDVGLGALTVVLYKCVVTGGTLFQSSSDNFGQPSFQVSALFVDGTIDSVANVAADLIIEETASTL